MCNIFKTSVTYLHVMILPCIVVMTFQPHYGPGVDSASNRNEYWELIK
jgi:hypothetical protein